MACTFACTATVGCGVESMLQDSAAQRHPPPKARPRRAHARTTPIGGQLQVCIYVCASTSYAPLYATRPPPETFMSAGTTSRRHSNRAVDHPIVRASCAGVGCTACTKSSSCLDVHGIREKVRLTLAVHCCMCRAHSCLSVIKEKKWILTHKNS